MPADSLAVLDTILDRMLAREEGKAVFRWRDFVDADVLADIADGDDSGLERGLFASNLADNSSIRDAVAQALDAAGRDSVIELIGLIAHQRTRTGGRRDSARPGIAVDELTSIAQSAYLSSGDGDTQSLTKAVVQFAFFGAGRRAGLVDFTHPILADYLAGLYAAAVLERAAHAYESASALSRVALMRGALHEALGDAPLDQTSLFARTLKRELARRPELQNFFRTAASTLSGKDVPAAASAVL